MTDPAATPPAIARSRNPDATTAIITYKDHAYTLKRVLELVEYFRGPVELFLAHGRNGVRQEIALDLRNLDLAVPPGGNASPVRSTITLGVGDVQVQVPQNADVTLTSTTGVGSVEFDGRSESSPGAHLAVADDLGADGVRTGRPLILDIETGAGSVEVHRG